MSKEPLHAHNATCMWGTTSFQVTSFSLESNADSQDIDITSMSSVVRPDPNNTDRFLISRDFDSCFSSDGNLELKIEFIADSDVGDPWSCIGNKRGLNFQSSGFNLNQESILSSVSAGGAVGEFIKCSAVFKLSAS